MTTPADRPARHAVYGELMWPEWSQESECYGVGGKDAAYALLDAYRAEILREVADECDEAGAAYTARAQNEHAAGAFALMETFRRKADEAEPVPAATEEADTEAQPPGGFTTRVCRNCRTAITWTPAGDWTHENADQECTVAALFELPTECHTAATETAPAEFELRGTAEIRAAVLREAWDLAHEEGSRLEAVAGIEAARGARCVAHLLRRMADEQPEADPARCSYCQGAGADPDDPGDYVDFVHMHDPGSRGPCPRCNGTGRATPAATEEATR